MEETLKDLEVILRKTFGGGIGEDRPCIGDPSLSIRWKPNGRIHFGFLISGEKKTSFGISRVSPGKLSLYQETPEIIITDFPKEEWLSTIERFISKKRTSDH